MLGKVNVLLLPIKLHYFLYNAGTAPVVPFLSTYARQLGLSSVTVGLIYTIVPLCGTVAKPVAGAVADKFLCRKIVFLLAILLTAAAVFGLFHTPRLDVERRARLECRGTDVRLKACSANSTCAGDGGEVEETVCEVRCSLDSEEWTTVCREWGYCEKTGTEFSLRVSLTDVVQDSCLRFRVTEALFEGKRYVPICTSDFIDSECEISCESYVLNELVEVPAVTDNEVYGTHHFWVFLLLMIFCWVGQAVTGVMADAICFELLDDRPNRYGRQRLYGALSYGIFSALAGYLIDVSSDGSSSKNYAYAFYLGGTMLLVDAIASCFVKSRQQEKSPEILQNVGRLLVNPDILLYLVWCACVGLCTGLVWQFLYWLIEDLIVADGCEGFSGVKTLQGAVQAVQCLAGELPFFFLSGWIFDAVGHHRSMSLVLLFFGIRFTLYSVIGDPWWFLPVELCNGVTSGLFYACMASYAKIVAPKGAEATVQGMVGASFEGLGVSLGGFAGGILYAGFGGQTTFRIFGVGAFVAFLLHASVQHTFLRSDKEKTRT